MRSIAGISNGAFRAAFVLFALFAPFSIAGMNFALGLAALAWTLWIIEQRGARVRPDALALASIALAAFALPSILLSENAARALNDWRSYWELSICFLVGASIARVRAREAAFWALAFSASVACVVAFIQRAGGLDAGPIHIGAAHRVGGTMFTMTFAGILYQLILFTGAVALAPRFSRWRWWLAAVVAMEFTALLLTMTRGAWVALFVGAAVLCMMVRRRAAFMATALALAVALLFSFVFARDQGRTIAVTELATRPADRNVGTRLVLWQISWDLFLQHPVFGVGMGDYTIEADRHLRGRKVLTTVDTHNVYLHLLATRGLVGFIPFVLYFVVLLRSLARVYARAGPSSVERYYAAGTVAVVAAILAGALTENNVDDSEVFMVFMFLVGIARSPLARGNPPAGG
ncbi:MAG: O-antigen ligase family protein [Candidatus Krumholzibacteria bacterium]|nr:O-antigen ligase family protein [Candidatus Krumholzibacteria bacterium]MDH4335947.1 O-antigen ligase family protein [Candidatus Krumholzibacteria bacterium]MDH5268477.1 O-antigen ligase family protein [Candidatus Krumholzibacteria bacterium]